VEVQVVVWDHYPCLDWLGGVDAFTLYLSFFNDSPEDWQECQSFSFLAVESFQIIVMSL
jgi:hypothetical protein